MVRKRQTSALQMTAWGDKMSLFLGTSAAIPSRSSLVVDWADILGEPSLRNAHPIACMEDFLGGLVQKRAEIDARRRR